MGLVVRVEERGEGGVVEEGGVVGDEVGGGRCGW